MHGPTPLTASGRPAQLLAVGSVVLTGLFTGAMLLVGVALVTFWQSLEPQAFLDWFAAHSHRVGRLMVPLGGAAVLATWAAAAVLWRRI